MALLANLAVAAIGILHVYILILEMFLWRTPRAQKAFGMTPDFANATAVLAANQGLYNGFLAAGLFWGLFTGSFAIKMFFLLCVLIAGVYGSLTANRRILFVQAIPAMLGIVLLILA